eukprot:m.26324 g.26324  ORF g.26324 m.26324 type:complete len:184 (+) comp6292_c0_seq2:161-712(+)
MTELVVFNSQQPQSRSIHFENRKSLSTTTVPTTTEPPPVTDATSEYVPEETRRPPLGSTVVSPAYALPFFQVGGDSTTDLDVPGTSDTRAKSNSVAFACGSGGMLPEFAGSRIITKTTTASPAIGPSFVTSTEEFAKKLEQNLSCRRSSCLNLVEPGACVSVRATENAVYESPSRNEKIGRPE